MNYVKEFKDFCVYNAHRDLGDSDHASIVRDSFETISNKYV